jgi:alpha-tubulin suppressor-like RCC1 family protein
VEFPSVPVPQLLLSLHKVNVMQVACGGCHCLARTDVGNVLSWGRGAFGCLGNGDNTSKWVPSRVKALASVTSVACGWSHSLCVDAGGKVWAWGKGSEGRTNHFEKNEFSFYLTKKKGNLVLVEDRFAMCFLRGLCFSSCRRRCWC